MISVKALEALKCIVGSKQVFTDDLTRHQYGRSSGFASVIPPAIVRPISTSQVSEIMALATQTPFTVYPLSAGKNWGYGDASAVTNNELILDLSLMNKIVRVDVDHAFAVIEPGVTQGQLAEYLQTNHLPLWMDSTGAGPDCSIVGNFSDRGFGHTRYGDHFASCAGLEVVLPDGRVLKTGFGHFPKAKAEHVFRYGVGPCLDGLFSQSNMGIITRMGVCLMPEPEDYMVFAITVDGDNDIHALIDGLRPLRQGGVLNSCIHIANDVRVFSGKMQYPWESTKGQAPLPDELRAQMRSTMGIGAWSATGILTGPPQMVLAARKVMKEKLPQFKIRFFSKRLVAKSKGLARTLAKVPALRPTASRLALLEPVASMMRGQPTRAALAGPLWRVRKPFGNADVNDILEHDAGIAWISPVMPASGQHTKTVLEILIPIFHRYGFDFMGTFTMLTERAVVLVSNVYFDKGNKEESRAGESCYKEAMKALIFEGYVPYRCAPRSSALLDVGSENFWEVVQKLKNVLDPADTISPGRYQPLRKF